MGLRVYRRSQLISLADQVPGTIGYQAAVCPKTSRTEGSSSTVGGSLCPLVIIWHFANQCQPQNFSAKRQHEKAGTTPGLSRNPDPCKRVKFLRRSGMKASSAARPAGLDL